MFFKVKDYAALQSALDELSQFLAMRDISKEQIFDSKLVACELLGNALKYAQGETALEGAIRDGFIELKILSESFFALPKKIVCADLFSEHGRGLFLVNQICEEQIAAEEDGIRVRIRIEK